MPSDRLDGQVVLVTGGGRGIGASIARELAGAGARVAVSARTRDEVECVADEVGGIAIVADVTRADDVGRMLEEVESQLGPIDLLVANAGIGGPDGATWKLTQTSGGRCRRSTSSACTSPAARRFPGCSSAGADAS